MEIELLAESMASGLMQELHNSGIPVDEELGHRARELSEQAYAFTLLQMERSNGTWSRDEEPNMEEEAALLASRAQSLRAAGASQVADFIANKLQEGTQKALLAFGAAIL